jgi:hypothetical protein
MENELEFGKKPKNEWWFHGELLSGTTQEPCGWCFVLKIKMLALFFIQL